MAEAARIVPLEGQPSRATSWVAARRAVVVLEGLFRKEGLRVRGVVHRFPWAATAREAEAAGPVHTMVEPGEPEAPAPIARFAPSLRILGSIPLPSPAVLAAAEGEQAGATELRAAEQVVAAAVGAVWS